MGDGVSRRRLLRCADRWKFASLGAKTFLEGWIRGLNERERLKTHEGRRSCVLWIYKVDASVGRVTFVSLGPVDNM